MKMPSWIRFLACNLRLSNSYILYNMYPIFLNSQLLVRIYLLVTQIPISNSQLLTRIL